MTKVLIPICVLASLIINSVSFAGRCDYPSDIAKDGSRCGDRAASVRPGGRNPDTDWIFWLLGIGVIGYLVFSDRGSSGNKRHYYRDAQSNHNSPHSIQKRTVDESYVSESLGNELSTTGAKKILNSVYGEEVKPEFEVIFQQVCEQAKEMGGNNHDAAARYILSQLGSMYDMPGNNITEYIDHHTRMLMRTKDKQSLEAPGYVDTLNVMREVRGLDALS